MSDAETLGTRHPDSVPWVIDDRIIPYLELTRLYDFHLVAYGRVDRAIITALVERWRQETHTFHLPLGEATITLLDVALLTRLPIEGRAVCTGGRQLSGWRDMVHRILGERPPPEVIRGSGLRCTWLVQTFSQLPGDADEGTISRYAKAYILYLIGAVLFADKTSNQIQLLYLTLLDDPWERIAEYSWGSAALGYLYRRLCGAAHKNVKEIAGPLVILQVITITFNSHQHLVNYILITFAIVSCGRGSIFLSANLTEPLVVVILLLHHNQPQMLRTVRGGISPAGRASTPAAVLDSTEIN